MDNDTPLKRCSKCGVEKPATSEFFCPSNRYKSGFSSQCRACRNEATIRWRANNPDKVRAYSEKYQAENGEIIRLKARITAKQNRATLREQERARYQRNPETKRRNAKAYRERNADHVKELKRQDYERNIEKRRAAVNRYRQTEQGKLVKKVSNHKRKVRAKENGGSFTSEEIRTLNRLQKGKCWYCGKSIETEYHIEHRVPLSRGGSNDLSNIVLSCPACNLSKANKLPHEWGDRLL